MIRMEATVLLMTHKANDVFSEYDIPDFEYVHYTSTSPHCHCIKLGQLR